MREAFRKRAWVEVRKDHPYNAETPADALRADHLTPTDLFYVRNHGDVPEIDPDAHRLKVGGMVERPLELSLEDLRDNFPRAEATATLYCAGNRRAELIEITDIPGKVPWEIGAAGNARWAGVLLRDVLREAGVGAGAAHAAFTALDRDVESGTGEPFGGSIPLDKALSGEVLLAHEMNGGPLPPEHGFPLRVVVGGYIGARSVKWLSEVKLQAEPSDNYYQAVEYKLFPPHVTAEDADPSEGVMLGEIPLNAVICTPRNGETLPENPVTVRGYAITASDRRLRRVEVSPDGGKTWKETPLAQEGSPSTWRLWEVDLDLEPGEHELVARAFDSAGGSQPSSVEEVWNFQGYSNNAYHRVRVRVEGREDR